MRVVELLWDQHNEAHIARHAVTPTEVEDVVFGSATRWEVQTSHRRPRLVALGPTGNGRLLFVVCEMPAATGTSVCVTARPATTREQRFYKEGPDHDR
ncbi:MAG: BrnT family toxin [Acidimicrobiales bacterium]